LAALGRIAQGFVNDEDYALAEDQWDSAGCLESELQKIDLGHLSAEASTEALSGSERQRIALLGAWLSKADWLILDEPDNHLDLPSKIALKQMLDQYHGALLVVSHDDVFLKKINMDSEIQFECQ